MICPQCGHRVDLTWGQYISAPFGWHRCPNCSAKFKLSIPLCISILLPLVQVILMVVGGYFIIFHMAGDPCLGDYAKPAVITMSISSIVFFCALDKYVKARIGKVRK